MKQIRYIHAADLHLDAPFRGISKETGGQLARILKEATFTALDRLAQLCESERPDFLVLAGDLYNAEEHSIKAQLRVSDMFRRLAGLGIPVFLAHGNHDPLDSRLPSVSIPENVTVFGPEPGCAPIEKDGETIALIHGISHARAREGRNLARLFTRDPEKDCLQLGVLHCTLDTAADADRYAPCSLADLKATGLDAWALGHVHAGGVVSAESPFAAYSGSTQGLHINEAGPRGCLLVTATRNGAGFSFESSFRTLGPVVWQTIEIALDGVTQTDELDRLLYSRLEALPGLAEPGCQAIVARLVLSGATPLNGMLNDAGNRRDLMERLAPLSSGEPGVWLKDIEVMTSPVFDRAEYLRRDDIMGCALRHSEDLLKGSEKAAARIAAALDPLYGHSQLRRLLKRPGDGEIKELLLGAERLCIDLLEKN
ncbi:MAG: DNA repair exonuclease [Desulfovibrio sp.]|nr:DNA repair exonuclease [Desulfovibrio sp.]